MIYRIFKRYNERLLFFIHFTLRISAKCEEEVIIIDDIENYHDGDDDRRANLRLTQYFLHWIHNSICKLF